MLEEEKRATSAKITVPVQQYMNGKQAPYPVGGGKNLIKVYEGDVVLKKYINNSGVITNSDANFYINLRIPVSTNTDYTLSTDREVNYISIMEYSESGTFLKRTLFANAGRSVTFTTESNTAYILVGSNPQGATVTMDMVLSYQWQLEQGSRATTYEDPENICPIAQWTDVTLSISNDGNVDTYSAELPSTMYGAVVDIARGEATSLYNSKKGTSGWEMVEAGQFRCVVNAYDNGDQTSTDVPDLTSTHYPTVSNASVYNGTPYSCGLVTIDHVTYLYVNDAHYNTLEGFQTYIADVLFVFKAHIPMSDTIEPQIITLSEGTNYASATATSVNSVGTCLVGEAVVG